MKKTIKDFQINDYYSEKEEITKEKVMIFAGVTGDLNPLHLDDDFAKKTIFKEKICHGMLSASFISKIIGTKFPGPGSIYLEQNLQFKKPVKIGDVLKVTVIVQDIIFEQEKFILRTIITNQREEIVIDGTAKIKFPNAKY